RDAIREAAIAEILVRDVVEGARAIVRAHAVDLHYDEAELGERLRGHAELLRHERSLRAVVDVLDDRVLLRGIEIRGLVDHAPDVGPAVAALRAERLGHLPSRFDRWRCVAMFQLHHLRSILSAMQLANRRLIDPRVGVDVVFAIEREGDGVIGGGRRVCGQIRAIEIDAVLMYEVRIFARVHTTRGEPDVTALLIHFVHRAHHPGALGDLILHAAGDAVVEVKVLPSVALAGPNDLAAVADIEADVLARIARVRDERTVVDERRLALLADQHARSTVRIDLDHAIHLVSALVIFERESAAIPPPLGARQAVGIGEERVVDRDLLLAFYIEEHRMRNVERVAGLGVDARGVL